MVVENSYFLQVFPTFIAINQRKSCLTRKNGDFREMLSAPCLNIAEKQSSPLCFRQVHLQCSPFQCCSTRHFPLQYYSEQCPKFSAQVATTNLTTSPVTMSLNYQTSMPVAMQAHLSPPPRSKEFEAPDILCHHKQGMAIFSYSLG